jgi:hypothetical protein
MIDAVSRFVGVVNWIRLLTKLAVNALKLGALMTNLDPRSRSLRFRRLLSAVDGGRDPLSYFYADSAAREMSFWISKGSPLAGSRTSENAP